MRKKRKCFARLGKSIWSFPKKNLQIVSPDEPKKTMAWSTCSSDTRKAKADAWDQNNPQRQCWGGAWGALAHSQINLASLFLSSSLRWLNAAHKTEIPTLLYNLYTCEHGPKPRIFLFVSNCMILESWFGPPLKAPKPSAENANLCGDRARQGCGMRVKLRFRIPACNPLRRSCVSSKAQNASKVAFFAWIYGCVCALVPTT